MPTRRSALVLIPALIAVTGLAACSSDGGTADAQTQVEVKAGDTSCELSTTTLPAGSTTFTVENVGSSINEFYVYQADGTTIVGEVEDIGPALTRELTVTLDTGSYVAACKPGMTGDGIRTDLTVS